MNCYNPSRREQEFRDWFLGPILARLERIERILAISYHLEEKIMNANVTQAQAIAALQAEVASNTTVEQSAIALLQGLNAQLQAALAAQDWGQVKSLSDQLTANDAALAAAISQNTPGAPASSN